jgi:hypothetical protein
MSKIVPEALATYAESWLGVKEKTTSNRGPEVDFFVRIAGGRPIRRPPWCAYFVTFCCDALRRMGFDLHEVRTGRAVNHWLKADESRRIARRRLSGILRIRVASSTSARARRSQRLTLIRCGVASPARGTWASSSQWMATPSRGLAGNSSSSAGHSAGSGCCVP